jgi:hypothetical protein
VTRYIAFVAALLFAVPAWAQTPPIGTPVINQGRSFELLTPNDSGTVVPTRGLHIGDAAACNISVVGAGDDLTAHVVLPNLQPGISYPFSIRRLRSMNTTCTSVTAIR